MSANILAEAKRLRNDCKEEYAHNVAKTSKYKNAHNEYVHFGVGDPKCNLFLFDVLNGAGVTAPLHSGGKWPFTAADWYGTSHDDFDTLDLSSGMKAGDIVSTTKHCGVAQDATYVIAAGVHKITLDTVAKQSLTDGKIRRYNK